MIPKRRLHSGVSGDAVAAFDEGSEELQGALLKIPGDMTPRYRKVMILWDVMNFFHE